MKVPMYVVDLAKRAKYNFDSESKDYAVGYTVNIYKKSPYQKIDTFRAEIQRFVDWANREMSRKACGEPIPEAVCVLQIPSATTYGTQYAVVNVFDPIMLDFERYICK